MGKKSHISFRSVVTILGGWVGTTVLLCTSWITFYLYFEASLTTAERQFTTVFRKVTIFSTLDRETNFLTKTECDKISSHPAVEQAQAFQSSLFRAVASIEVPQQGRISTELFFESVPDNMLDVPFEGSGPENTIPIIIPKTYLNLYNLGFSRSQGLPVVSPALLKSLVFNIDLYGNGQKVTLKGRIAGFTTRFNTLLVPQKMLEELNRKYGSGANQDPVKLVVVYKSGDKERFLSFLDEMGLESEESSIQSEIVRKMGLVLIPGLIILAFLLISLCGLLIVSELYLRLSEKSVMVARYFEMGYHPNQLLGMFLRKSVFETFIIVVPAYFFSELVRYQALVLMDLPWTWVPGLFSLLLAILTGLLLSVFQRWKTRKILHNSFV